MVRLLELMRIVAAANFCRPDVLAAEQSLFNSVCPPNPCLPNPCLPNPCPPFPCPPRPGPPVNPCIPSDAACQALKEVELILRSQGANLSTLTDKVVAQEYNDLYQALLAAYQRTAADILAQARALEVDVSFIVAEMLQSLEFTIGNTVRTDFTRAKSLTSTALTTAKNDVAAKITALSTLTDAEILANLQDFTTGFLKDAYAAADTFAASAIAAYQKQEKAILSKIDSSISAEKAALAAAISKLFKEFEKSVKTIDATYAASTKKALEVTKGQLEKYLRQDVTTLVGKDSFLIVSILRTLIEKITNCNSVPGSYPITFLSGPRPYMTNPQFM